MLSGFLMITYSGHIVSPEGGIVLDWTYWLLEKMLITSHSWKLILKPSWTILVNSFNFFSSGEGGGQQCHRRAGAPPCLISTLPFFFSSKILETKNTIYSFYKAPLGWPVSAANRLSASSTVLNQPLVTAPSRPAEATTLEWRGRSEGDWRQPEWWTNGTI